MRIGALATAAGILVSFWALAGAAILARPAGAAVGWGMQFQQPGFVAFLAVVVLLLPLNLWGLFEIPLPARLKSAAERARATGEGLAGHFASGLFATLMATPCSAPFLGTALSFALAQSGGDDLRDLHRRRRRARAPLPAARGGAGGASWMPRPGNWMLTLRGAMGFLLAGAVGLAGLRARRADRQREPGLFQLGLLAVSRWRSGCASAPARAPRHRLAGWRSPLPTGQRLISYRRARHSRRRTPCRTAPPTLRGAIVWKPFDRAEAERLAAVRAGWSSSTSPPTGA